MTITIRLNTENAAFAEDRDMEIYRILIKWLAMGPVPTTLRDSNGNTVGRITVTGK